MLGFHNWVQTRKRGTASKLKGGGTFKGQKLCKSHCRLGKKRTSGAGQTLETGKLFARGEERMEKKRCKKRMLKSQLTTNSGYAQQFERISSCLKPASDFRFTAKRSRKGGRIIRNRGEAGKNYDPRRERHNSLRFLLQRFIGERGGSERGGGEEMGTATRPSKDCIEWPQQRGSVNLQREFATKAEGESPASTQSRGG